MTKEEAAARGREAIASRKKKRRRRKPLEIGDKLPSVERAYGLVGVRKMAVKALQQQVEALKDRFLGQDDRDFLIKVVNTLVTGEKVGKLTAKVSAPLSSPGEPQGTPLPALEPRT